MASAVGRGWTHLLFSLALCLFFIQTSQATPVTLYQSFAGNLNFQVTGGTLRIQSNPDNPCTVTNSGSANLSGVPGGAIVEAAFLYWAGSGSTSDLSVTFESNSLIADRSFSESVPGRDWFSGFKNVTSIVQNKVGGPNGTYIFADLTVDTGGDHCTVATVLSGWSLVVIYETTTEPLRVINLFDGLQNFWGSSLILNPSNFRIPASGIDGKFAVLTWEGDVENSTPLNGFNEVLQFNGTSLVDAINPLNNQYNSTINTIPTTTSYGVDFDAFNVSPYLVPSSTAATTTYSTGQDRVLLGLQIVSVTNTPVADLAITKSHVGNFGVGQQGIYTISVLNNGPVSASGTITVTDTLPTGLTYVSGIGTGWTCNAAGQNVSCTRLGPLADGATTPAITLTVNVALAAAPSVNNTATVSNPTFDNISGNNSSTDATTVLVPNLTTSTKTVLDLNGGDAMPGDRLRYSINSTESNGVPINNVSVTDTINAPLINFAVTNAGGGTNSSTPGTGPLNITNISIPANGTVTVQFEVDVSGAALPGAFINNTAVINNPITGVNTNAVAPTLIVAASTIPGSGTKQLYFAAVAGAEFTPTLPQTMTRTALTVPSTPARLRIQRQDAPRRWDIAPTLQSTLGLSPTAIPVILQMRRDGNNAARNFRISIDYTGTTTGVWGCLNLTVPGTGATGLIDTVTRTFIFNVPQTVSTSNCTAIGATARTLNAGTTLRVTVDNEPAGALNGQPIFVYPFDAAVGTSRVELPATTVINVDSVNAYTNVAYPGGVINPNYSINQTIRARAIVSDPFGSFDITGATITIIDSLGATVIPATAMLMINDSGAALKTFELSYTIPNAAPLGNWTMRVTANEGAEGTITDLGTGVFTVVAPSLSVTKLVSTISDPVNAAANPKAIPGAIMEYQIIVQNMGGGATDNNTIIISEPLPANLRLFLGSPINPVQFNNGVPISGLTYTFTSLASITDDIEFSNDGGITLVTPTGDAQGFDTTVPAINFIRILPKGSLSGNSGSGNPNFTLRFRMRVE